MILGLIGTGIRNSLAPALHTEEGRCHGLRIDYRLLDLDDIAGGARQLPAILDSVRREGFAGVNVTYPCKQSVMDLIDVISPGAEAIGAVNTVVLEEGRGAVGHNTDATGWSWGLRRALPRPDLTRVALLGAGGAGAACAHAVLELGAREVVIVDRVASRAEALAMRLNERMAGNRAHPGELATALRGATGLIHATPTGMASSPGMPLPESLLTPGMWVSEVVYRPLETTLVKAARARGCTVVDGGHMNVGQALGAFTLFTGLEPDAERMDAHFRKLVIGKEKP
jgi:shikimate dehydrogenase